jgi:thiol:disulfide interchange protein DsbD
MAAALGFAFTQSTQISLAIFAALGVGFALPFVLLGVTPALARWLPKPGAWMVTLRQLLAFPMYGAAGWLIWVLSQQTSSTALAYALGAVLLLAFAIWAWSASRMAGSAWRATGALVALAALLGTAAIVYAISFASIPPAAAAAHLEVAGIPCERYTSSRLADLRHQDRPVFVDATASWCITCLVNEKVALSGQAVHEAFASHHIAYLVADWTKRDPEITALLQSQGRSGVPLYLYYAPGAATPKVMPQILTEGIVLSAITSR